VLKIVILSFQVGFTGDFVPDCPLKLVSGSSNFDTAFLPDCIENLMRITKMCLKLLFDHYKLVLHSILYVIVLSMCFCHFKL